MAMAAMRARMTGMRKPIIRALAVVGLLLMARASTGCTAPLSGAACPCLAGYVCNEALGVCVEVDHQDGSPLDDAGRDAAPPDDAGGDLPDAGGDSFDAGDPSDGGACDDACPSDAGLGLPDADVDAVDA